ncbi:hypothetical protein IKS57_02335 [bacterium]|nr:hypothetical protein [bacterium]
MSSFTAADALYEQGSDNLINAVQQAIGNEITTKLGDSFNIDAITYTVSEIISNLTVTLPPSITSTDDENAQIPGVGLSYNNISLIPKLTTNSSNNSKPFIITGFTKVTNSNNSNISVSFTPITPTSSSSYLYNPNTNKLVV